LHNSFTDYDGSLLPLEFKDLPFFPKRIFTVSNVPKGYIRGNHAHYETKQLLLCLKGEILVHMDYGNYQKEYTIKENESILVDNLVWDFQKFLTGEDILLVMCSTEYDKNDYIDDSKKFKTLVKNGKS
jgi:dTDP-4-dehydrorhamnose 3,5-epimerase-like enzyme